jgi:hypothetical protein
MDRCPPSVVARREPTLPLDQPTGPFPDTLTEAVLTRQGRRVVPGPGGTGMNEGAAAEGEKRPVPTPLEILDGVHACIRIDAEGPDQLPAWQSLDSRSAAALGDVLTRRRQLPADRDRAVRVHWPVHRTTH